MIDPVLLMAKAKALDGLRTGALKIVGSVVRYTSGPLKGSIHSHLQPTAVSEAVQQTGLKLDGLQVGQDAMKGMLGEVLGGMGTLHIMSGVNLALSVADIGISVAGFALMNAKLNAVQHAINGISGGLHQEAIERDFIKLRALVDRYESSWLLSDARRAAPLLLDIASNANETQLLMENHAAKLLAQGLSNLEAADRMLDGMALTLGLRVSAAMAANEVEFARGIADDGARRITAITGVVGLADVVRANLPKGVEPSSADWTPALSDARLAAEPLIAKLRTREANAVTRSAPLTTLKANGVEPRDWLAAARAEKQEPVLFLAAA
jgi:hypothetical protein